MKGGNPAGLWRQPCESVKAHLINAAATTATAVCMAARRGNTTSLHVSALQATVEDACREPGFASVAI